ncbi:MAG: pseudouridine synthase [Selenomonadaceae bacterium]|nr:pseudouridine synthase [Selenomonadaceae bacterium]
MERLQKIIAKAGICSRRAAEKLIAEGKVKVDGSVVTELGFQAEWPGQEIEVEGKKLSVPEKHVYILINKPRGYISTASDDRGRKTVLDLVPTVKERIYPVGRLDYDTEGLLLLTNDGELMNGLLHPRQEVKKTYIAMVDGELTGEKLEALRSGVDLSDGKTAPAQVLLLPNSRPPLYEVRITIHEGRNRQVRRMFESVGCRVISLRRVRFAALSLKGLECGGKRALTEEEVAMLYEIAGLEK